MAKVCFDKQLCSICLESFSPLQLKRVRNISICAACLKLIVERKDEWLPHHSSVPALGGNFDRESRTAPLNFVSGTPDNRDLRQNGEGTGYGVEPPETAAIAEAPRDMPEDAGIPAVDSGEEPTTLHKENFLKIIAREGKPFIEDIKSVTSTFNKGFIAVVIARVTAYFGGSLLLASDPSWLAILNGAMTADIITWFTFNIMQIPFVGMGFAMEFFIYGSFVSYLAGTDKLILFGSSLEGEPLGLFMFTFLFVGMFKTFFWATRLFCLGKTWGE